MGGDIKISIQTKVDAQAAEEELTRFSQAVKRLSETAFKAAAAAAGELKSFLNIGAAAQTAAKGQTALTKATKAAGAAAKGALAAFDELNVLESKSGAGGGSGGKPPKPGKPDTPDKPDTDGEEPISFLQALLQALEPLTQELFAGLQWGYENVLKPLSQWVVNQAAPAFLRAVGEASGFLGGAIDLLKPAADWLWENFLQPMGQWSGEILLVALDGMAKAFEGLSQWIADNKVKLTELWEMMEPLLTLISETVMLIFDGIKDFFKLWVENFTKLLTESLNFWLALITGDWAKAWESIKAIFEINKNLLLGGLGILWEAIKEGFGKALTFVQELWAPLGDWFMEKVMSPLQKHFGWLWDGVLLAADIAFQMVTGVWEPLGNWFMERVVTPVTGMVKNLWSDIYGFFTIGLDRMREAMKEYIDITLRMVESGANLLVGIFNKIISALNSISVEIPDWVPKYGGESFGISIPYIPQVSIPRLATGAVIPANAQFAAILGDQRSGRNLEAPEGLIRDIVREESGSREIVIRFEGSMAQLARVLSPVLSQESARQGTRLVMEGA